MNNWKIQQVHGTDYVVRARLGGNDCYCDVEAFTVFAWQTADDILYVMPDKWAVPLVPKKGATGPELDPASLTSNLDAGHPFFIGSIKFDGCLNGQFSQGEQGDEALHFCGRADAVALGVLMGALFDVAREVLPSVLPEW